MAMIKHVNKKRGTLTVLDTGNLNAAVAGVKMPVDSRSQIHGNWVEEAETGGQDQRPKAFGDGAVECPWHTGARLRDLDVFLLNNSTYDASLPVSRGLTALHVQRFRRGNLYRKA